MGFNDMEDYELRFGQKIINDDDMIIDDSGMREPVFDLQLHAYLEDDRKVYYYTPKLKTDSDKIKDLHTWFWTYTNDSLYMNNTMKMINIQEDTYLDEKTNNEVTSLSAVGVTFSDKVKTESFMYMVSDNPDMTASEMLFYQKLSNH